MTIDAVEHAPELSASLLGFRLDSPTAGSASDRFSIDLRGWVAARDSPPVEIEAICHHEAVMRTPVDVTRARTEARIEDRAGGGPIGFRAEMGAFRLPPRFELSLRAVLTSGTAVPLAKLRGRRLSLGPREPPAGLRPVVVSTPTGRTGTSWAVDLLSRHPGLVAQAPLGMEPRPATYWLEAASALAEPASYMQALRPKMQRSQWWLGGWPDAARQPAPDEPLAGLLGRENVLRLAAFARDRVEAFYEVVARGQGKRPVAFVEKGPSGRARLELMADVFPGLREVVLVRDPRDTLCSILAYTRKRPDAALVRENPGTDDGYIRAVARAFLGVLRQAEERRDSALVVRYEDLVLAPETTLATVLEHLDVDSSAAVISSMLGADSAGGKRLEGHRTSRSSRASVGRWRDEMGPELQARANEAFADVTRKLGYD